MQSLQVVCGPHEHSWCGPDSGHNNFVICVTQFFSVHDFIIDFALDKTNTQTKIILHEKKKHYKFLIDFSWSAHKKHGLGKWIKKMKMSVFANDWHTSWTVRDHCFSPTPIALEQKANMEEDEEEVFAPSVSLKLPEGTAAPCCCCLFRFWYCESEKESVNNAWWQ